MNAKSQAIDWSPEVAKNLLALGLGLGSGLGLALGAHEPRHAIFFADHTVEELLKLVPETATPPGLAWFRLVSGPVSVSGLSGSVPGLWLGLWYRVQGFRV